VGLIGATLAPVTTDVREAAGSEAWGFRGRVRAIGREGVT